MPKKFRRKTGKKFQRQAEQREKIRAHMKSMRTKLEDCFASASEKAREEYADVFQELDFQMKAIQDNSETSMDNENAMGHRSMLASSAEVHAEFLDFVEMLYSSDQDIDVKEVEEMNKTLEELLTSVKALGKKKVSRESLNALGKW